MAKFTVVREAPKTLEKGEIVINTPNFIPEIQANVLKEPKKKQTAINHLREVLNSISQKYDSDLDVMRIRMVNYEGIAYKNDEDLNALVVRILATESPKTLDKVLDTQIKARPMNTKLVYYVGPFAASGPFYNNGLDFIEEKDVESYMTGKPKKTVGKPAVTKEQAEAKNEEPSE